MSDDTLRAAERAWREQPGDAAAARLLSERVRLGLLDPLALDLAVALGHRAACVVAGVEPAEAEPTAWVEAVTRAAVALGPEACLRAAAAAAHGAPVRWERFDGPDDVVVRLLDALDGALLAPAATRRAALEVLREAAAAAMAEGWGAVAAGEQVLVACAVAREPENAATLLRDGLERGLQSHDPAQVRAIIRDDVAPWALDLGDPVAARRARIGRRFSSEPCIVRAIAFSPDGAKVALAARTGHLTLRDAASGDPLHVLRRAPSDPFALAFSPDGARLWAGDVAGVIAAWDVATGEARGSWPAHEGGVTALRALPDGRLVSAGYDGALRVWSGAVGDDRPLLEVAGHERKVAALAVSPDGALCATGGSDQQAALRDLASGTARWTAPHPDAVQDLAFMPDGASLLTACDDGHVRRLEVATGQEVGPALRVHERGIYAMALSPDGDIVATAHFDGVRLTRLADGERVAGWPSPAVQLALAFAPDGRSLLAGARSGAVRRHALPG